MRTNIEIDDDLMEEAMKAGGFRTKKEAVQAGLQSVVENAKRRRAAQAVIDLKGKIEFDPAYDYKVQRTARAQKLAERWRDPG